MRELRPLALKVKYILLYKVCGANNRNACILHPSGFYIVCTAMLIALKQNAPTP